MRLRALSESAGSGTYTERQPPSVVHVVNTDECRGRPADNEAQVIDGVVQLGHRETSWQRCTSQPI